MMNVPVLRACAGLVLALSLCVPAQVKRSRAESVPDLIASNTVGFGDIWLASSAALISRSNGGTALEPYQAVGFGLSQNMSIFAGAVPFEGDIKKLIGRGDAHLKLTLPDNDNLRLFGLAVQGDLVLSTEQDTVSRGQDSKRPAYAPRAGLTVALDADLIKRFRTLPLKVYLNWSMFDNDRLLVRFSQQSWRGGVEYKGPRHSGFLAFRYGLYKPIVNDPGVKEGGYDEYLFALMPGGRYRILSRFSLTGSALFTVAAKRLPRSDFYYDRFSFKVGLEFPLFYRETNTEAIRSMIFLETRKTTAEQAAAAAPAKAEKRRKDDGSLISAELAEENKGELMQQLKPDEVIFERDEKLKQKRRKIDDELKKIEEMLE